MGEPADWVVCRLLWFGVCWCLWMGCAASGATVRTAWRAAWCAATSVPAATGVGPTSRTRQPGARRLLYGMGNMSFSMIGRLLGASDVAVLKWVRAEASALPDPAVSAEVVTVEVDEMWRFLEKSLPSSGC